MDQAYTASGILLLVAAGIVASDLLYDRGVSAAISRRVSGLFGGGAYFIAVLRLDPGVAIALSGTITLAVLILRLGYRQALRGLKGTIPTQAWAEITYPLAGTFALAIGWGLLGDKWLAFVPIAFMAWGDILSGFVSEAMIWRRWELGMRPSLAMLGFCLAIAALFQPYWIGATGALAATAAERFPPSVFGVRDDNWVVVGASLTVMAVLTEIIT